MKRRPFLSLLALLLVGLCACSKGETGSSGSAGAAKPLAGKAPTRTSQFEGRWVRVGEAEFDSLEFMTDGKALVGDADSGIAVDYAVLEGGRLGLTLQGGMTSVYDAVLSGDQLELKSPGNLISSAGTFRYRRLAKDETVRSALQAQAKAAAERYRKRVEALRAYLEQPHLVLAFADSGPASIALEIELGAGGFQGRAWHDDRPPHLNAISGRLELDQSRSTAQVSVTYGARIAPPATQPDGGGQITMTAEGEGQDLRISAQVTIGGGGPAHELVLRSDRKLHAEIVARYEAELARIEKLKQPLIELLGDHARLRGRMQSMDQRSSEPDTVELALVRDPQSGQYWCEGLYVGPRGRGEALVDAAAEIAVVQDRPVLRIVTPPARQYLLDLPDQKAPRLSGQWMPTGSNQGFGAQFEVVDVLDASARDARFAASRKVLQSIPAGSVFTGLAFEGSASGMEMPIPCRLQLTVAADGGVSGTADYPSVSTRMTLAGKIVDSRFGPRLQLSYTAAEATPGDKIFLRSIQGGSWSLAPLDGTGPLRLSGFFDGPPARSTVMTLANAESAAQTRKELAAVLGDGERLHVARFVGWQVPGVTPTVLEWSFDEASGKVTGRTLVDGRALGSNEKMVTSQSGTLEQQDGWSVLKVVQSGVYRGKAYLTALQLYACEDVEGVLHLGGMTGDMGPVAEGQPPPEFPTAFGRPVDLVPVSSESPQLQATIAQALAAVEQARTEADAAAEEARLAALDARRAKLAPFLPLFAGGSGLVITTDSPATLGAVISEARVDEAQATITGTGVDLREMPLRDFTFECGIDNWGNLTVTTSLAQTPYAFAAPKDGKIAAGRYMALTSLSQAERAPLDERIALCRRLQSAAQTVLKVEILDPATAKAREAGLTANAMPGVALYRNAKNDKVAAMFTPQSNGRYLWTKEPVLLRLDQPLKGSALYIRNGGPTDNLVVVINGVHRAVVPAIDKYGAAIVTLPPDLEIVDLRLQADGTAQARGVVLLP